MKLAGSFLAAAVTVSGGLLLAGCDELWSSRHRFAEPGDQARITVGMSREEVTGVLGEPWQVRQFRNQPGPTLVWKVRQSPSIVFDVDLDAQGRVQGAALRDMPVGDH